jgi:hypothetical protein
VDGANVGSEDTSYPYTYSWNSGSIPFRVARHHSGGPGRGQQHRHVISHHRDRGQHGPRVCQIVTEDIVTAVGATISWTSDEPATSQIEYGLTNAYGNLSALNSTLDTSHSVTLAGLSPVTTYHYRVRSRDSVGNLGTSGDNTFTTIRRLTLDPSVTITNPERKRNGIRNLDLFRLRLRQRGCDPGRIFSERTKNRRRHDLSLSTLLEHRVRRERNPHSYRQGLRCRGQYAPPSFNGSIVIVDNTTDTLNPPKEAYAYPDPATHGAVPTLRAFFDDIDTMQINIYDVAGQTVESVDVPAVPAGVENGRLYYEWPWTGAVASGRYFVLVCGKNGSEKSYVKTVVRVVR